MMRGTSFLWGGSCLHFLCEEKTNWCEQRENNPSGHVLSRRIISCKLATYQYYLLELSLCRHQCQLLVSAPQFRSCVNLSDFLSETAIMIWCCISPYPVVKIPGALKAPSQAVWEEVMTCHCFWQWGLRSKVTSAQEKIRRPNREGRSLCSAWMNSWRTGNKSLISVGLYFLEAQSILGRLHLVDCLQEWGRLPANILKLFQWQCVNWNGLQKQTKNPKIALSPTPT